MIHSIQTNTLILICDDCNEKAKFKDESAYKETGNPIFGERGNYEYATKVKGWMIKNHSCRCPKCKGTPKTSHKTNKEKKK